MRKLGFGLLILATMAQLGCKHGPKKDKKKKESRAVPVRVAFPENRPMERVLLYTGKIEAKADVKVVGESQGRVSTLKVEEGQSVNKGSLLAELDRQEARLSVRRARVNRDKAKADFERAKKVFAKGLIAEQDFLAVEQTFRQTQVALSEAIVAFGKTRVLSPISGVVASRWIKLGDQVQIGTALFQIVDFSQLEIPLAIPEMEIGAVKERAKVRVVSDAYVAEKFSGSVLRIAPIVDPQTGTFKVTVRLNPSPLLRPGMFVRAELVVETHPEARVVPRGAVIRGEGGGAPFIMVVKDDKAQPVRLPKALEDGDYIEVGETIPADAKVVVVGQSTLKPGDKVQVEKEGEDKMTTESREKEKDPSKKKARSGRRKRG